MNANCLKLIVLAVLIALPAVVWAAPPKKGDNKNSAQEKKDDAKVKQQTEEAQKAQRELQEDNKHLADAEKDLATARAKLKSTARSEVEARDSVAAKQERLVGMDKATTDQAATKAAYEAVANPILSSLKDTGAYKAAKVKAEAAIVEMRTIQSNAALSAAEKRQRETTASSQALGVGELERNTINADKTAVALKEKYDAAQGRVAELRQKIKVAVDADSSVKAAHQDTSKAKEVVAVAETRVAAASKKLAASRAKLSRETQDVAQAKVADKANDNKGKNDKKKK